MSISLASEERAEALRKAGEEHDFGSTRFAQANSFQTLCVKYLPIIKYRFHLKAQ